MGFSGAPLAMSAVQGINSIASGYAQNAEDKYNNVIDQGKINYLQTMGDIQQGQMTRQAGQTLSKSYAIAGASGLEPTGSEAAVMLSTQTQMETDKAIAAYNTSYKISQATAGPSGVSPVYSGYSNAFADILKGAGQSSLSNPYGSLNLSGGANVGAMPESVLG